MNQGNRRNLQLDILRGIAILLVFGRHLEMPRPAGLVGALADAWFRIGWLGVDLFFVLSGFLIGGLLVTELHNHGRIDISRFLVRRGLKIYPPYFVFIGYLMLIPSLKALLRGGNVWTTLGHEWTRYWPNLLFLQNYIGDNPAGHTWSLAVEEHFYLMLPFGLAVLAATRRIRSLVVLCLFVVPLLLLAMRCQSVFTADPFSPKMAATHLRLDALLFGVGIRGLVQYFPARFQAVRRWRAALFMAGIALWSLNLFIEPSTAFIRTLGLTGTFLGSAAFLVAAYHTHRNDLGQWQYCAVPVARVLAWIGIYSYAIYLWHVTAIGIGAREFGGRLFAWGGGTSATLWLLATVFVTIVAVLIGVIASKLVDWPVLRVRDKFFPSRSASLPTADTIAISHLPQYQRSVAAATD